MENGPLILLIEDEPQMRRFLRAALTGRTTSPGIFDVLAVLDRQECLARLGDQAPS